MISVLYVDDEQDFLDIAKSFLENYGDIRVDVTTSPLEAQAILAGREYDAVVSDYMMPELNGIELLKYVRETCGDLPFILFTEKGREEVVIQAIDNGVDFYLQKGGRPAELFAELAHKIKQAVRRKGAEASLRESETLFREISERISDIILIVDEQGKPTYVSPAIEKVLGYSPEEVYSGTLGEHIMLKKSLKSIKSAESLNVEGKPAQINYLEFKRKNGTTAVLEGRGNPIIKDGKYRGVQIVLREITEYLELVDKLQKSSENFSLLGECLSRLGSDSQENISSLTAICGRMLNADYAVYYRLAEGMLDMVGKWQVPPGIEHNSSTEGRICYDVIRQSEDTPFLVRHVEDTPYSRTDPEVMHLGLKTYVGRAVKWRNTSIGSLCAAYTRDAEPGEDDLRILSIIASAIGSEEDRIEKLHTIQVSEDRFRTLADNVPAVAIRGYHSDGTVFYWNKANERVYGYTKEEAVGKNLLELIIPPEMRKAVRAKIRHGAATGKIPDAAELLLMRKDGSRVPVLSSHAVVHIPGRKLEMYCIDIDLTPLKQMQEKLKEREESYRSLFNSVAQAIFIQAPDGTFIDVNRGAERMLGYPREDLIGKNPEYFSAPDLNDLNELQEHFRRAFEGETQQFEFWSIRSSGDKFLKQVRLDKATYFGQPVIIGVATDVTEPKRMEMAIRSANKKLKLLSSITRHDILNQLTVLQGYLGLLGQEITVSSLIRYIEGARRATDAIDHHITFTQEYQDLGTEVPRWQNLDDIMKRILQDFPQEVRDKVTTVEPFSLVEINADPLLWKVFYNLFENAIRHGGKVSQVSFSVAYREGGICLICEDDGTGIPPQEKEHIFNYKYGKGTGHGLFLAREILGISGSTIRETGIPGKGARFEILVPSGSYRIRDAD